MKRKKGVSEMISYVLLIAITIGVSIGVYSWLKYQIPSCSESDPDCLIPKDCSEDASVIINDYDCNNLGINITLLNNGRFNISGIILTVTDDSSQIPNSYLKPVGSLGGNYGEFIFQHPLRPGDESIVSFSSLTKSGEVISRVGALKLQIFLFEGKGRTICKNVLIRETIKNCNFS